MLDNTLYLRFGLSVRCINKLIEHSIDKGAYRIYIKFISALNRIEIIDDSSGIAVEVLRNVGESFDTNYFSNENDYNYNNLVYKIRNSSNYLFIWSKYSGESYVKIFSKDEAPQLINFYSRELDGTTVTVYGLLRIDEMNADINAIQYLVALYAKLFKHVTFRLMVDTEEQIIDLFIPTKVLIKLFKIILAREYPLCDICRALHNF